MSSLFQNVILTNYFLFDLIFKFCYTSLQERTMTRHILFSLFGLLAMPTFAFGACSVANLTRCLDSACAINIGSNPAARCQYCGSSAAGTPPQIKGMKAISAGASMKYIISDKELKKAPSDPGERYIWATQTCIEKLPDCTNDDVTDNYDKLIEQSCTSAGISAQMANLVEDARSEKSQSACTVEISACVKSAQHCLADFKNCEADVDFDRYFSQCSVAATGCDSHTKAIRSNLMAARDSAIKNADKVLNAIVVAYQTARENKLKNTQNACIDYAAKTQCMETVCQANMPHKCELGFEYEQTLASELCEFHKIACDRLK